MVQYLPKNTTSRFPLEIKSPSVGQSSIDSLFGLEDGTNAYEVIPLFANVLPNSVISTESPFVKRRVTTSFAFASSQLLTVSRKDSRVPASSRKQEV